MLIAVRTAVDLRGIGQSMNFNNSWDNIWRFDKSQSIIRGEPPSLLNVQFSLFQFYTRVINSRKSILSV